jgi:hypothetical protein
MPEAQTWHDRCVLAVERLTREILNGRLIMLNKRTLMSVMVTLATTIATLSFYASSRDSRDYVGGHKGRSDSQ